jgi:hypothetical protein
MSMMAAPCGRNVCLIMNPDTILTDTIYQHERYGTVLVTGIGEMYDEYPSHSSGNVLVFFYDDYDAYGGMSPIPLSQSVGEFRKSVEYVREHD